MNIDKLFSENGAQSKSGVNPNLYDTFTFQNATEVISKNDTIAKSCKELNELCVYYDGGYYIKDKQNNWFLRGPYRVENELFQLYNGTVLNSGEIVDRELIRTFIKGEYSYDAPNPSNPKKDIKVTVPVGACESVDGLMLIPYGPTFVSFKGRPYLNNQNMSLRQGNPEGMEHAKRFLRQIYRALCDGPELHQNAEIEEDMLLMQVVTNDYTQKEFRFLINWLSGLVQYPGINMQSNVWLFGDMQGVGKGTLFSVMSDILGNEYVTKIPQEDVKRGWSDFVSGKILVCGDEFETDSKAVADTDWDIWIKKYTCEEFIPIVKRNSTPTTAINISNYMFLTNKDVPIKIGELDRRNQFILTTADRTWVNKAADFLIEVRHTEKNQPFLDSFTWLLRMHKFDKSFANKTFSNIAKESITDNNMDIIKEWILTDSSNPHRGKVQKATALYNDSFEPWALKNNYNTVTVKNFPLNPLWLGRRLVKYERYGLVSVKIDKKNGNQYCIPTFAELMNNKQITTGDLSDLTKLEQVRQLLRNTQDEEE